MSRLTAHNVERAQTQRFSTKADEGHVFPDAWSTLVTNCFEERAITSGLRILSDLSTLTHFPPQDIVLQLAYITLCPPKQTTSITSKEITRKANLAQDEQKSTESLSANPDATDETVDVDEIASNGNDSSSEDDFEFLQQSSLPTNKLYRPTQEEHGMSIAVLDQIIQLHPRRTLAFLPNAQKTVGRAVSIVDDEENELARGAANLCKAKDVWTVLGSTSLHQESRYGQTTRTLGRRQPAKRMDFHQNEREEDTHVSPHAWPFLDALVSAWKLDRQLYDDRYSPAFVTQFAKSSNTGLRYDTLAAVLVVKQCLDTRSSKYHLGHRQLGLDLLELLLDGLDCDKFDPETLLAQIVDVLWKADIQDWEDTIRRYPKRKRHWLPIVLCRLLRYNSAEETLMTEDFDDTSKNFSQIPIQLPKRVSCAEILRSLQVADRSAQAEGASRHAHEQDLLIRRTVAYTALLRSLLLDTPLHRSAEFGDVVAALSAFSHQCCRPDTPHTNTNKTRREMLETTEADSQAKLKSLQMIQQILLGQLLKLAETET